MISRRKLVSSGIAAVCALRTLPATAENHSCGYSRTFENYYIETHSTALPLLQTNRWHNNIVFRMRFEAGSLSRLIVSIRDEQRDLEDQHLRVSMTFSGGENLTFEGYGYPAFGHSDVYNIWTDNDIQLWRALASSRSDVSVTIEAFGIDAFGITSGLYYNSEPISLIGFTNALNTMHSDQAQVDADQAPPGADLVTCLPLQDFPSPCFLTTACVDALGLKDDCLELRTLRAFRDGPMRSMPNGARIAANYYEIAPALLARIPAAARADAMRCLYVRMILPCVVAARLGLNRLALRLYGNGTLRLLSAYAPDILQERRDELRALFGKQADRVMALR